MTLSELGDLGDFLGGIGVIVTLVYLAIQIRRNTQAVRSASLSPEERTHFYLIVSANFYHLNQGYAGHRSGTQSVDTWTSQWQGLQFFATQPGVKVWWENPGKQLIAPGSDFWRVVDAEIQKPDEPDA